jgi:hypothetical protein
MYKVYLAKLKRTNAKPSCVYKVGITSFSDAEKRLKYNGADEPFPIIKYFPDIKVMKTIWVKSKEHAEKVESDIMQAIGNGKTFHDWYEPDQISGITEMRKWNYDEIQSIFQMMDRHALKIERANNVRV